MVIQILMLLQLDLIKSYGVKIQMDQELAGRNMILIPLLLLQQFMQLILIVMEILMFLEQLVVQQMI